MRKLFTLLVAVLLTASVFAQSPEKMSYQAVIRNNNNQLVTSQSIGMQISILQGSASGTVVYVETQTPISNANGLISIEIGAGTVVSGNFSTINWANGPYFVKTETDPTGGTNYTIIGTNQLLSVPYALYANRAGNSFSGNYNDLSNKPDFDNLQLRIEALETALGITLPTVNTNAIINITQTTATSGGVITSDGGATVTERGVCWSTSQTPTITDNKTTDGTGAGSFTSAISGLTANTTYYVRAYATNNKGTGYGSAMSFTTLEGGSGAIVFNPNITYGSMTDIDGNTYKTVTIGTQTWMAENLKVTKYNDGTNIPNVTDDTEWGNLTTGAYCNYNNDQSNVATYGRLYNWYAVNTGKLCPTGWHVPSDAEWTTLEDYLIANGYNYDGTTIDNKIAKAMASSSGWESYSEVGVIGNDDYPEKQNASGFTALPGG